MEPLNDEYYKKALQLVEVTSDGRILSRHGNNRMKPGQEYRGSLCAGGYYQISITIDGERRMLLVHRLVALKWVPNPYGKPCINHLDQNRTNNRADNLEWCTAAENNRYGGHGARISRTNRKVAVSGLKKDGTPSRERLKAKTVMQFDFDGRLIAEFESAHEAARQNGIKQGGISNVCRGEQDSYMRFRWSYK